MACSLAMYWVLHISHLEHETSLSVIFCAGWHREEFKFGLILTKHYQHLIQVWMASVHIEIVSTQTIFDSGLDFFY